MKLDNVFKKTRIAVGRKNYITFTRRPEVPEGLLRKCNKCGGSDHCGGCKERSLYLSKVRRIFPRACKTQNRDDHR